MCGLYVFGDLGISCWWVEKMFGDCFVGKFIIGRVDGEG